MIGELLPGTVVTVESYGDDPAGTAPLHPAEAEAVAHCGEGRRREFAEVRACARAAMTTLGVPPGPVLPGRRGAPVWPDGVVGSMTHCAGYRAAALARSADLASLGIDAEPHAALPDGVLAVVSSPAERARLERLAAREPGVHGDRLLFSAKESVYKAWFPLTHTWLDFTEADVEITSDRGPEPSGRFRARFLVPGPVVGGRALGHVDGRWVVRRGLVATAVAVPHR